MTFNRIKTLLLGVGPGAGGGLAEYLPSLSPTLLLKFNEASGNIINYGSDGGTGTVTGCTQGQTGPLGPNTAYSFDGIDDVITIANAAIPATKGLTTQRWAFLVKANTLGENLLGSMIRWSANASPRFRLGDNNVLVAAVDLDTTDALAFSNNNQISDCIGAWVWLFADYDDANSLGLGRRIRLFKGVGDTLTQLTLATNTAGVGTVVTPSVALCVGNNQGTDSTWNGLMSIAFIGSGLWDTTIMSRFLALTP